MKRLVGLDLGSKSLGVAISDPLRVSAQGLKTIKFEEDAYNKAIKLLEEMLAEYEIEAFILGNPKHMSGEEGKSSLRSQKFKAKLQKKFNIPVILWDERLTSVLVNKAMIDQDFSRKKRKEIIDTLAATNILQGYLDSIR
jgi:putative holliday junction resolvase